MPIYVVTGKLGNGKTLLAVRRIQEALQAGRRVATNLDLHVAAMLPPDAGKPEQPVTVLRIPDKPKLQDLVAIGQGCDAVDESRYGLLVLDELAVWLNARSWADKDRQEVIDWLVHSRKLRWDVIFIVQNLNQLDKQVREALTEYLVTCKRLDRVRVPFFGWIGQLLTLGAWNGRVGRLHLGVVVYAAGSQQIQNALVVDRWFYRGTALFQAYDTEQVFRSDYPHGVFSYLPPWHTVGRYRQVVSVWKRVRVVLGLDPAPRTYPAKPPRLSPLLRLSPDVRWLAARRLVARGLL